ncbi:uracil permease [Macrophomina phaseolina]|uniref:Uracil permease n=1 Tax=Macrophomina phaseolina TaxID=35725 RepID=A0ABQ8GF81_9PEZI|nr:uracil permease [Macrophomina phaseolina]
MATKLRFRELKEQAKLRGNEAEHEEANSWSNRDLIPLPPSRRTWGWFHFFGYWAISSLNVTNWQSPNTFLTYGLSVPQSLAVIVIGRALISFFSTLIAWCGLRWHIGFTIQNRFTWGMRGSYIPLLQRILLNFIWCAVQCWNGGRLTAVCITAIWPSFATMHNTLPSSMPTTTYQFVGFIVFWCLSFPFLLVRPEKFKLPFQITSIYCGVGMICMLIWSLAVAKGVGPLWSQGQTIPATSSWNSSWLMMRGINQMIGGIAAGITNGSDFSRYARGPKHYLAGTILSAWVTGTLVSLVGLVVTSACQKIYGEIYWNPPDLLMRMMDSGHGSSKARAGVFFLSAGFALTGMFENVCGNAVAGGIDLAGLFPKYIDIRRGAMITFIAVWIVQPWQLINKAATFVSVLSSFSVFLSPIMGVMVCDFYILRRGRIRLSHLYRTHNTDYWFWKGVNWRVVPCWLGGWAPTIGGLVVTVQEKENAPRVLYELYFMAFLIGFFVSGTLFWILNTLFPYGGYGEYDESDVYGTFTPKEAAALNVIPADIRVQEIQGYNPGFEKEPRETVMSKD